MGLQRVRALQVGELGLGSEQGGGNATGLWLLSPFPGIYAGS